MDAVLTADLGRLARRVMLLEDRDALGLGRAGVSHEGSPRARLLASETTIPFGSESGGYTKLSHRLETRLVLDALEMAVDRRPTIGAVLFHSDRGSQYASEAMRRFHDRHAIVPSTSRKANCWDNAVVESFFSKLKLEIIEDVAYETRELARAAIFSWIEIWYNRRRRHSTLGYVSPEQFELNQAA